MITRRSRVVRAPRPAVWEVVGDPWHLPRWWPRTARVEGVSEQGWTSVLSSERGRSVRADWTLEASEPPELRRWFQELAGTPFARLFEHHAVEVRLEEAPDGTEVTLAIEQTPRGWARMAPFLMRRAARVQIEDALTGLARVVEPSA